MEILEEYRFDFIGYLSENEKSNPAINIFDKNNPIVMLRGQDFDLSTIHP
jgi:uncharacterized protein YcsI (UPF0317 family)